MVGKKEKVVPLDLTGCKTGSSCTSASTPQGSNRMAWVRAPTSI